MYVKSNFVLKHKEKRIVGTYYIPKISNSRNETPTVIISHGLGETERDSGKFAEILVEKNICCVTFDFCGGADGSRSSGSIMDMSVFTEKEDLLLVLDEVTKNSVIHTNRIFLMGMSQGGMVSAMAARDVRERVSGLILLYPGFNIPDMARERNESKGTIPECSEIIGITVGRKYYQSVYDTSCKKEIAGFHGPVLLMHGTDDEVVPIYYSKWAIRLYPNARLIEFSGCGHNFEGDARKHACEMAAEMCNKNKL